MFFRFHKEGAKIIFISVVITAAVVLAADALITIFWLQKAVEILAILFLITILQFFRNPNRSILASNQNVTSPVDGKVVVIEEVYEKEFFQDKRLQVSIFMSPVNVHVTRFPVGGKVVFSKYHPGKFLVAWHPKSSEENERTTVVIENKVWGPVLYRQIAGALAKRIVNYAQEGMDVVQGEDGGFIKFGSRVDVFLPIGTELNVKLGQKVKGNITILATKG